MKKRLFEIELAKLPEEDGKMFAAGMKIAADDIDAALEKAKEIVAEMGYLLVSKVEQVATIEVV